MARWVPPVVGSVALAGLWLGAACSHDWETLDPRLGGASASSSSGAAGSGGAASASSDASSGSTATSSSSAAQAGGGGSGGSGGGGGCGDILSDRENCGVCGHDCLGGECITGFCQPFTIATASNPIGLLAIATELYWGNLGDGTITVADKDGKNATVYAQQASVTYLATDGASLFWAASTTIRQRALGGGPIADLVTGTNIEGLELLGNTIYFTESDQGLFSAPKAGGAVTAISVGGVGFAEGVATDSGIVYWCDNAGTITAYDPQAMTSTSFVTGEAAPAGLCIYDGVAYWTNQGTGELRSRPISGGAIQTLASGLQLPTGVAADDKAIYWAEYDAGLIRLIAR